MEELEAECSRGVHIWRSQCLLPSPTNTQNTQTHMYAAFWDMNMHKTHTHTHTRTHAHSLCVVKKKGIDNNRHTCMHSLVTAHLCFAGTQLGLFLSWGFAVAHHFFHVLSMVSVICNRNLSVSYSLWVNCILYCLLMNTYCRSVQFHYFFWCVQFLFAK